MKANELMIGDWVQGNPCGQHCDRNNKIYYKIAILDIGNHCWGYSVCGALVELKYDNIFPIPLTPDILENNEINTVFKIRYKGFYLEYHAEAGMIVLYVYNNGSFQPTGIGFKYVHELQHALRLCGIEKEIVL